LSAEQKTIGIVISVVLFIIAMRMLHKLGKESNSKEENQNENI